MIAAQCISRDALKEYVSGWSDAELNETIESHLTQCEACEQTLAELERDPESLLEFVRRSRELSGDSNASDVPADSALAYALAQAKKNPMVDSSSAAAWQPPAGDFGPYELLRPLGAGGMASVYLARHKQLGKQVAIKLLPARQFRNDHYAARFQREIRTAGQLNHPAIVNATDAGEQAGTHYLVMEYIEGLDLSRVARLNGPLRVADACAILRTVAIGLSHAHAEGIVHRDIKPSNLMLSQSGDVKVLDFGLAQVSLWDEVSAELTTVGQLMGTLDYMAPEQAERPDAVDYRADLYSIGATMFRLLCGRAPLAAAPDLSPLAKLRLLASHQPPRLDTLRSDAPENLVAFVAQLLARDPGDRPASAAHVAEQLLQFTEGADLKALIAEARRRDEAKNHIGSELSAAARRGMTANDATQVVEPLTSAVGSHAGRGGGWSRWWVAAAMLPLFVFAGVLITLETQKGQLVIESESDDVEVKLLRDGKFYESLQIQPGANATRLYAGKYEVILSEGSDSVTLDQPTVEIKRGGTVIARVTEKPPVTRTSGDGRQPTPQDLIEHLSGSSNRGSDELLYDGKPLSMWLRTVEVERSSDELTKAILAMAALRTDDASSKKISLALINTLRDVELPYEVTEAAFNLLRKCQKDSADFYRLLANELKTAKANWRLAILRHGLKVDNDSEFGPTFVADFEPMRAWIVATVLNAERSNELTELLERQLGSAVEYPNVPSEVKKLFVDMLAQSSAVGYEYWLGDRYIDNGGSKRFFSQPPSPESAAAIEAKAIAALSSVETPKKFVIQASMVLKEFSSKEYDRTGMPEKPSREVLAKVVAQQFERLAKEPDGIASRALIDNRYRSQSLPSLLREMKPVAPFNWTDVGLSFAFPERTAPQDRYIVAIELLDLVRAFELKDLLQPQLEQWVEATSTAAADFASLVANPFFKDKGIRSAVISVGWPRLDMTMTVQSSAFYKGRLTEEVPNQEQLIHFLVFERSLSMLVQEDRLQALLEPAKMDFTRKWLRRLISGIDEDSDGKLSLEEAERGVGSWVPKVESPMAESDKDGNKFLSEEELIARFASAPPVAATNTASLDVAQIEWATKQISKYDKDGNGGLTQDEWQSMLVRPDGADADGDGLITVEEFARFRLNKKNSSGSTKSSNP